MGDETGSIKEFSNHYKNVTQDISLAISKLEVFSKNLLLESENPLQRTIYLAKRFIGSALFQKIRNREKEQQGLIQAEVLDAIHILQKNLLFIEKLKNGTPTEKQLAESAIKVVERYNQIVISSKRKETSIFHRLLKKFDAHFGFHEEHYDLDPFIHLPLKATAEYSSSTSKKIHTKINSLANSQIQESESILQTEADAFRLKAISLLKTDKNYCTKDEFQSIKSTPIHATVDSSDLKKIRMQQVVSEFPGETIFFVGEFQRHKEILQKSIPISTSFEMHTNATQTGFPHPIQYTGWALADCMIPIHPLKLHLLTTFKSIYTLKLQIATDLLPKGALNQKAKSILKAKKDAFYKNLKELLSLHHLLNQTLFKSASENLHSEISFEPIDRFFKEIKNHSSPFEYIVESEEFFIDHLISKPFEKLKEEFLEAKTIDFESKSQNERYLITSNLLIQEREKIQSELQKLKEQNSTNPFLILKMDYVLTKSAILASASDEILLQHLSEMIGYKPKSLSPFAKKVQEALYKQLILFQKELTSNEEFIYDESYLKKLLIDDIDIFNNSSSNPSNAENKIVDELELYFSNAFHALKKT